MRVLSLLGIALLGFGCGGSAGPNDPPDSTWTTATQSLTLSESASPVDNLPAGAKFYSTISYGSDPQQVFDAFLPAPTSGSLHGAVIFVHGGGFVAGSRTDAYTDADRQADIRAALTQGVAWLNVDYRLLLDVGVETEGVRKSLHDSRRALQFIRFHATQFNIDPRLISMYGVSAGAGTSVWLGFHDDMKETSNSDLIARESTRLTQIGALQTQGTYDVLRWVDDIFAPEYPFVTIDLFLSVQASLDLLTRFYGLSAAADMDTGLLQDTLNMPPYVAYRADLDMFALASPDDPPLFMRTPGADISPIAAGFDVLHHPLHPKTLYEKAKAAGVKTILVDVPAYQLTDSDDMLGFLAKNL